MPESITPLQTALQRHSLQSLARGARDALLERPALERGLHILWLLGPFILLIESAPADIWLTVLSLAFVACVNSRRESGF